MMTLTKAEGELLYGESLDYCIKGTLKQESQEFLDNPRVLSVDIEVYGTHGGIDKVKNDPIIMIGVYGENLKKVLTWKKFDAQDYVEVLQGEAEMIERFIEKNSAEYTYTELWKKLPKKVMWQTYLVVLDYLQSINKIALDRNGTVGYIWNPELAKKFAKRPSIEI